MSLFSILLAAWAWAAPRLRVFLPPVGLLLLFVAAVFALHSWNFARHRVRAIGVVTENTASFAPQCGIVYSPRIRFRTADGTMLQPVLGPASSEPEFIPGAAVPVLYCPGQPGSAVIATTLRLYAASIWCGVWGTVLLDAGLVLKRFSRSPSPSE